MKQPQIAIIGVGLVGATIAYTLVMRNIPAHILLVDINSSKCRGELADLSDCLSFSNTQQIEMIDIAQAGQVDIAIICAGIAQKPGQSRTELLQTNATIIKSLAENMAPFNPELKIIMVTNPVDVLTYIFLEKASLNAHNIFGSSTYLDSIRLRFMLSNALNIAQQSIQVDVLGEHGDNQFVFWSGGSIAGVPLLEFTSTFKLELDHFADKVRLKAYEIIENKGATSYGVASCVVHYCESIIYNKKLVMPISCYIKDVDMCLSMPAVVGQLGVEHIVLPTLNSKEQSQLKKAIESIRTSIISVT